MIASETFLGRLRRGGVEPDDSEEVRIRKSILVFAMGLLTAAPMFWLTLYWYMGLQLSATLPLAYQIISVALFLLYIWAGNFRFFKYAQLSLFLFFPFIVQLSIGNFISASGAVLWGMLAPIVAVPVLGTRRSIPWFVAHVALVCICGAIDLQLLDTSRPVAGIPLRTSALFFTLNFVAIASVSYFLLRYAAAQKEQYEGELRAANVMLRVEQERSEKLLLNILPEPIAERLKQDDQTIADGFADVSVMFADIVNFTQLAEGMSPNQIFSMLNRVFSDFDELAEKHGLEKIKTIGDAYMVAGGLNEAPGLNYTWAIADMALDMCRTMASEHFVNDLALEIRVGIGTGPVVAGVVGKKKFIYDLWGDTVNLASRITSDGGPGAIQVDAMTYRRLRHQYDFHPPRTVHLKGKGDTPIYRLIGKKPQDVKHEAAPEAA